MATWGDEQGRGGGGGQPPGWAPPPQGPWGYQAEHPRAVLVLVLGILSVVACQVLGPVAWVMGRRVLADIDASGGRLGGRGTAQIGWILGIVGTAILALSLVVVLIWLVLAVAFTSSSGL